MSNTRRPTTARKITPKDEAARKEAMAERVDIRIDGTVYSLVPADMTGLAEMKIRQATGMAAMEIVQKMQTAPGMDLIGCYMYACEVAAGRTADLEGILGSISWATDFDVVEADEAEPVPQR